MILVKVLFFSASLSIDLSLIYQFWTSFKLVICIHKDEIIVNFVFGLPSLSGFVVRLECLKLLSMRFL